MRERVGMVGGQLAAGPTPDGGFSVDVTLPWDPADAGRRLPEADAGRDVR
jgi:signal transduction histidine kinase